jgi:hypothetical protein
MSIQGSLTQISPYLLEKVKKLPSLLDVFWSVSPIDDEAPKIKNLQGFSSEWLAIVHEILPNPQQVVRQWTLQDFARVQYWKAARPEDYERLKADVYRIVIEGKTNPTLDLFQDWHLLSYIFRNDSSMDVLPFLTDEAEEGLRVNAVLCGQTIDEFTRCLEAREVQQIAEGLSKISETTLQHRIQHGSEIRTKLYSFWTEDYENLLKFCHDLKEFYTNAADRGNAMLIQIV